MKALIFGGGFLTGAASMLALVIWILSEREKSMVSMTMDNADGSYGFRGWMTEWPNSG